MTIKQRKLISFDWAIKKILRSKANFEVLEGFLSELLFDDIKISEVLESENNKNGLNDKFSRLNLKVKNSKDEFILVKIQYSRELNYLQQMLYGTSKVIVEHSKESEIYAKIVKVISINILYFDLGIGDDYIYKGTTSFIALHNYSQLKLDSAQAELYKTDGIEDIYPEYYLIRINNFNDVATDSLDQWIYFLKNEEIKDDFRAKGLVKAREILDYSKCSEEERQAFEAYKDSLHYQASMYESTYVIGRMEGKAEGKAEGKIEGKVETLILLLESRFGELSVEQKEYFALLQEEQINQLLQKLWTTQSLQEFLG